MKKTKAHTPKDKTTLPRSEAVTRYARARLLAHPALVLRAYAARAAARSADFRSNSVLFAK